jgi:hypothetical protein
LASETYSGYYAYGFEESLFVQIGNGERWWLTKLPPCAETAKASPGRTPILYIEARGSLSTKGTFGHLGKYERELTPNEFLVCRELHQDEKPNL